MADGRYSKSPHQTEKQKPLRRQEGLSAVFFLFKNI